MSFYTKEELLAAGFSSVGNTVQISKKSSLYVISGSIGNNVRIDDFCILKGRIVLGNYIHIGSFCLLTGVCGEVNLQDCSVLSSGVHIYTGSDDYRADVLSSGAVPKEFVKTIMGGVFIGKGSIVGAQSLLLPNTYIEDGVSIGAHCIIYERVSSGAVMVSGAGKARQIKQRDFKKIVSLVDTLVGREII
jgi:acetyltransferase-like isoleucine patch superfamily enzyme